MKTIFAKYWHQIYLLKSKLQASKQATGNHKNYVIVLLIDRSNVKLFTKLFSEVPLDSNPLSNVLSFSVKSCMDYYQNN